jgi:hypothetical protein
MVGHKSAECRGGARRTNLVEVEEEAEETGTVQIGGVWLMGHVDKVQTHNQFQALTRADEEAEEEEQEKVIYQVAVKRKAVKEIKTNSVTGRKWKQAQWSPAVPTNPKAERKLITKPVDITQPSTQWKVLESPKGDVQVKLIAAATRAETAVCQMTFHLTDANKVLASVIKMTAAGNEVVFNQTRSFIKSPAGKKAYLRKRNGVYVLDVVFFNGDEAIRGEVIIDSGAADHVMPRSMLESVVTREKEAGIKFVAANGAEIGNYGRKDVQFVPVDFWEEEFGSPFTGRA